MANNEENVYNEDTLYVNDSQVTRKEFTIPSLFRQRRPIDKGHLKLLFSFVFLCVLIVVTIGGLLNGIKGFLESLSTALLGIAIGASFSILERMGFSAPIEDRLENLLQRSDQQQAALSTAVDDFSDYGKYGNSRKKFGFQNMRGDLEYDPKGKASIARGSNEFSISAIEALGPRALLRYMNTFLEEESKYEHALKEAICRGVHVRLLMIEPTVGSVAFSDRYNDCFKKIFNNQTDQETANFIRSSLIRLESIIEFRNDLLKDGKKPGTFSIRYYRESLNFPMILITNPPKKYVPVESLLTRSPDVAYTGFYGQASSEAMPYIEWRGGDFELLSVFQKMFDDKFATCSEKSLRAVHPAVH